MLVKEVTDDCKSFCGDMELNLCPVKEQIVFLTFYLSLQPWLRFLSLMIVFSDTGNWNAAMIHSTDIFDYLYNQIINNIFVSRMQYV